MVVVGMLTRAGRLRLRGVVASTRCYSYTTTRGTAALAHGANANSYATPARRVDDTVVPAVAAVFAGGSTSSTTAAGVQQEGGSFRVCGSVDEVDGAAYAPEIRAMWGNVPRHIKRSFAKPPTIHGLGTPGQHSAPAANITGALVARAKGAVAHAFGAWAPAGWADLPVQYDGIPIVPYEKGRTAAHHYSSVLIPRPQSHRIPMDMLVDPVYVTSDPRFRFQMQPINLFSKLQGKVTCLLVFSGQPLSGLWTGAQAWRDIWDAIPKKKQGDAQCVRLHMHEGWFSRRTHQLTKFVLRRQVDHKDQFDTLVYRGKWHREAVRALHAYNKDLPAILLVDRIGYVRWHAVGLPTPEAVAVATALAPKLLAERSV